MPLAALPPRQERFKPTSCSIATISPTHPLRTRRSAVTPLASLSQTKEDKMKKYLLALGLWVGLVASANAQCVGVGGINNVPQPGLSCGQDSIVPTYVATSIGLVPGTAP